MSPSPAGSRVQQILQQLGIGDDESLWPRATCLHTLYLTDPQHNREELLRVKGSITQGTCNWILSGDEYRQWENRDVRSKDHLWIYGGPGSGKTMLSIFLSKHLGTAKSEDATQSHSVGMDLVLYFFCSGSESTKNSESGILRGLLLEAIRQRPTLLGLVQQIYENQQNDPCQDWSFDTLWMGLRSVIRNQSVQDNPGLKEEDTTNHQNPVTYIIVDGLDECESASIRRLSHKLSSLGDDKELGGCVKVMIISREKPALRDAFAGRYLQLNLEEPRNAQAVYEDVQKHIIQRGDRIASPDRKDYSTELCSSVKDCLARNCQGNLLWVSMAVSELESTSRIEAWEHLSRLPPTLDAMYEWMVMQIPHEWRELSTKLLLWVTLALRPLSISELVVALDERRLSLVDRETIRDCINRCGQILRIVVDDTVHLIHNSAREYLWGRLESSPSFFKDCVELNPLNLKEGHKLIASVCIRNLKDVTQPRIQNLRIQKKGAKVGDSTTFITSTPTALSDYAMAFWTDHVRNAGELMLDIVDSNSQLFEEHSPIRGILAYEVSQGLLTTDISVLHHAAYYGFAPLVGRLVKKGWWNKLRRRRLLAQRDGLGRTALHLAVHRHDNGPIVELLLNRGANVSCEDNTGATALDHAIKYGTPEIVGSLAAYGQRG
ncbi:hypothetical protein LA080_009711 [Diaporthe eres]|nr:hypothetical protein LA080_009711 [Diaporthe eres]